MRIVGLTFPEEAAEKFRCPLCGKEYKTAEALEKHRKDKHPAEKEEKEQ